MNDFFATVEFPFEINLPPSALHRDMHLTLEENVKTQLSGVCRPNIGYIKPGSVQIVKKLLGQIKGSHATGNVTFRLQVRCLATWPVKGQSISCSVIAKNDAGILAKSFYVPYMLFIPKMPGDDMSETIDRVSLNTNIMVRVLTSTLKAPSKTTPSEYWVICELDLVNRNEFDCIVLPKILILPVIEAVNMVKKDTVDRVVFTGDKYLELETSKDGIDTIVDIDYRANIIKDNYANMSRDPLILSEVSSVMEGFIKKPRTFVVGEVTRVIEHNEYQLKVGYTNGLLKVGDYMYLTINQSPVPKLGNIILHYRDGRYERTKVMDFWGAHVKYIINPNEMISIPEDYAKQLEYIKTKSGSNFNTSKRDRVPVSRSYYKMIEMFKKFKLLNDIKSRILCIAESPGGFIQALVDLRKSGDSIVGVSISTDDKASWSKLNRALNANALKPTIRENKGEVFNGEGILIDLIGGINIPNTQGDILLDVNVTNLIDGKGVSSKDFLTEENKADLVTADGGFPHDKTALTEEMDASQLILAEILIALRTQKHGGSFVLKIFDMATEFTVGLLSILSYCYEKISIFKPSTSRNASSEKYIICTGYNIKEADLLTIVEKLKDILSETKKPENKELVMNKIILGGITDVMKQAVVQYNIQFMKKQMNFINEGVTYTKLYCDRVSKGHYTDIYQDISSKATMQYSNAANFNLMM